MKEYDTSLWEERYESEKYGLEAPATFKYFQKFLKLGKTRNLKKLSNKLSNKSVSKRPPKYETLREYAAKWKWYDRAKEYDNYQDDLQKLTVEQLVNDFQISELKKCKSRIKSNHKESKKLDKSVWVDEDKKAYAKAKHDESYMKLTNTFYQIANNGRKQPETVVNNNNTVENKILNKQETNFKSSEEEAIAKEAAIRMAQLKKVEVTEDGD